MNVDIFWGIFIGFFIGMVVMAGIWILDTERLYKNNRTNKEIVRLVIRAGIIMLYLCLMFLYYKTVFD